MIEKREKERKVSERQRKTESQRNKKNEIYVYNL